MTFRAASFAILAVGFAMALSAPPSHAGSVSVKNCSGTARWVASYNDIDKVHLIPFKSQCLAAHGQASLTCLGSGCTLAVGDKCANPATIVNDYHLWGGRVFFGDDMRIQHLTTGSGC